MTIQKPSSIFLSTLTALLVSSPISAACKLAATQAPLLELYTSEGCSSCPPADAWLSQHTSNAPSANSPIALAFHVDYWNSLGWIDRFASASNSERQRSLASTASAGVYTPGFFLNGAEWRGFFSAKALPAATFEQVPIHVSALLLERTLEISSLASNRLFVAISESSLANQVRAGENRNRLLKHDHVVRLWQPLTANTQITLPADLNLANAKLVVWREINGKAVGAAQVDLLSCR
jgi:hypothetical protein